MFRDWNGITAVLARFSKKRVLDGHAVECRIGGGDDASEKVRILAALDR